MCAYKVPAFFIIWLVIAMIVNGKIIYVYRDSNQKPDRVEIDIATCSNLPKNVSQEVSSVDTRNQCARLYAGPNCTGDAIEILPRSPSHSDLTAWSFNDRAVSLGPCLDPCGTKITGEPPKKPFNVTIFDREDFKGAYIDLAVEGCTWIPTQFVYRLASVSTNGYCVQLWRNTDCVTNYPPGTFDYDTIELRLGTPKHNNILEAAIGWWFKEARAVSHCSYKCNRTDDKLNMIRYPAGPDKPKIGEIVIFDGNNFTGHWTALKLEGSCLNLEGSWEGVTRSIRAYQGECVTLFDRRDCYGKTFNFISHEASLADRNFEEMARSMRYCNNWSGNGEGSSLVIAGNGSLVLSVGGIIGIVVGVIVIIGVGVGIILILLRRLKRARRLSEREIREFLKGFKVDQGNGVGVGGGDMDSGFGGSSNVSEIGNEIESGSRLGNYDVEVMALHRAYNTSYEVDRKRFSLDGTLGMGEFGIVYKGTLSTENDKPTTVAVKTLKSDSSIQHLRSLMKEVKVMLFISELGKHPSIVRVVGCCTELLRNGDLYVLMEFCYNGSLESYLRKNSANFKSILENGSIDKELAINNRNYSLLSDQVNEENIEVSSTYFDLFQQIKWMIEIASGMEFLSSSKIVHRDLAARNILLDSNFQAKISDFGLSRKTYNYSGYLQKGEDPMPWRWLPPESLLHAAYSTKSDVWSYGVLCWEIFSLGESPFAQEVWGKSFIDKLVTGYRLAQPKDCIEECYQLMLNSWNNEPAYRPAFSEITRYLKNTQKNLINITDRKASWKLPKGYVDVTAFYAEV